jgi:hypothetical protein
MNVNENFKNLISVAISLLKPFEQDNTDLEKIFFYLSELASNLKLQSVRDVCIELMLYCRGSETCDLAYKNKDEILVYLNK